MNTSNASVRIGWRWQLGVLWVGVVFLLICSFEINFEPAAFYRAYLAAYLFYLGIALGSMVMLMAYHLTGGSWGWTIRRILESAMDTLPLLAVLFLPIAFGLQYLYPWADPGLVDNSPKLQYQQFYLQPTYFWIRAAAYFAAWLAVSFLLGRWSGEEDRSGSAPVVRKTMHLSAVGAVVYGISIHFASVDWTMSLVPAFHSTIWGPLFATGQMLSGFSFALIVVAMVSCWPPMAEVSSRQVRYDLGSLLLTLLALWAYMAWFQFMLVWIANIPADVVWYVPRTRTPWKGVMWAIFLFHFAIPFFLLLSRAVKRTSACVAWIAGLILLMHYIFINYQIMPGDDEGLRDSTWIAIAMPLGIGGVWLAYFLWQLSRRPLLALHDRNRAAALRLRDLDQRDAVREEALAKLPLGSSP